MNSIRNLAGPKSVLYIRILILQLLGLRSGLDVSVRPNRTSAFGSVRSSSPGPLPSTLYADFCFLCIIYNKQNALTIFVDPYVSHVDVPRYVRRMM